MDQHDRSRPTGAGTGTPRWVMVFAIIAAGLALLVAVILLAGGDHGPGRHSGGVGLSAAPAQPA